MASNTDHAIKAFLFILGWSFATDGEKFMHFSEVFTALGVTICLSESLDGRLTISNTAKRVSELAHIIQGILDDGFLPCGLALKLRGRMQFADGQVYGRAGRLCLRAVTEHAYRADSPTISQHCRAALCRFKKLLVGAKPRVVFARHGRPFVIFTDAAFEPSNRSWPCGVGGVLVDPGGKPMAMFSQVVPQSACVALGAEQKKTIIFEAELLAVVCALKLWSRVISGSPTVVYVDNNSARDVAISGSARSEAACSLLDILLQEEFAAGIVPWYQRVPSPSNIADAPSKRLGSSSMLSGSDSRGRAQPWQKSTEPLALTSTREKCYGRLKTVKSKNGKKQGTAKPALSRKVQDFEGCLSPCRTMTWSKEDWRFSIQNSPSARFAIWSANTSRKRSFWQVYGLCTLALLACQYLGVVLGPTRFSVMGKG